MAKVNSEREGLPRVRLLYLIISLVILGLVGINVIVSLFWLRPFGEKLKERRIEYLESEAKRAKEIVEKSLESQINELEELSFEIALGKDQEIFIERFLKENAEVKEISLINLKGKEERRYSRSRYFTKRDLRDFSFLEKFKRAKEGEIFLSHIEFAEETEPYLKITLPIRKYEIERPRGVLRAEFNLREIWSEVGKIKIGKTGRISIIDDKGMLIADSNPSRVLKKINLLAFSPVVPLIKGERLFGITYFDEEGVRVTGAGVPIKNLRWGVIAEEIFSEVEAELKEVKVFANSILIAGIIVMGLLTWVMLTIKGAHQKLIWRGLALEKKTRELEEARELLEMRVEERTKELQEKVEELEKFQNLTVGRELKMIELKKEIERLKEELRGHRKKKLNEGEI